MITALDEFMYGDHMYENQRALIICNSELDSMAMMQGINHIGALKHALCVSAPDSSEDDSYFWINRCREFLSKFETIIIAPSICGDGVKFRETCFEMLINFPIRWIDLSPILNSNHHTSIDDLLNTQGKKAVADLLKHVEKPPHSCGMLVSKINRDTQKEIFFTGFYGLDRACKFKFGELAVLAGESNDGKTTMMRQMMIFAVKNGVKLGCMFGEETNSKFMDLTIRQAYHGEYCFESTTDVFGDNQYTPKFEVEDRFKLEFGEGVNLFQIDKVREIEKIGNKLIDWICHCSDIEGRRAFFIDNLMKVTADEESDEYRAQASFIEKLYRTAQKKGIFIMMIVHTKKITGLIDQNSIHGTKKIYNTPDHVVFFQRMDRFSKTNEMSAELADKIIRKKSLIPNYVNFTSFMWAHKIRDRNPSYSKDLHVLEYDYKTTCSTEILTKNHTDKVHKNGWSKIVGEYPEDDDAPNLQQI